MSLYDDFRPVAEELLRDTFGVAATLTRSYTTEPTLEQKLAGDFTPQTAALVINTYAARITDELGSALGVPTSSGSVLVLDEPKYGDQLAMGTLSGRVIRVMPVDPQGEAILWEVVLA